MCRDSLFIILSLNIVVPINNQTASNIVRGMEDQAVVALISQEGQLIGRIVASHIEQVIVVTLVSDAAKRNP